jgi:demethylmacrocin O-methyltransferase
MKDKQLMTLDELAHLETDYKNWTDKRSGEGMGYLPIYERYFAPWRNDPIHLMEIGVNMGASITLWLNYFPNAKITGVDIEKKDRPVHERYQFIQGDQMDKNLWRTFVENQPKIDILIDDGGHRNDQIETTYWCLWQHLKPGGLYCIEDLGAAYNPDCNRPGFGSTIEFIKLLCDRINMSRGDMETLHMYRELCIIRKKL